METKPSVTGDRKQDGVSEFNGWTLPSPGCTIKSSRTFRIPRTPACLTFVHSSGKPFSTHDAAKNAIFLTFIPRSSLVYDAREGTRLFLNLEAWKWSDLFRLSIYNVAIQNCPKPNTAWPLIDSYQLVNIRDGNILKWTSWMSAYPFYWLGW